MITLTIRIDQQGDGAAINPTYTDSEPTEKEKYVASSLMNALSEHMKSMGAKAVTPDELESKIEAQGQG